MYKFILHTLVAPEHLVTASARILNVLGFLNLSRDLHLVHWAVGGLRGGKAVHAHALVYTFR